MNQKTSIEIPTSTILKILGILLLLWFLWYIRNIVILLFIVLVIVAALSPLVKWFVKRKMPRFLAVILIYLTLAVLFSFLVYLIIPPIVAQISELTHNLPNYIEKISPTYYQYREYLPSWQKGLGSISSSLAKLTQSLWSATITLFGGFVSFVTILVLSIYILLDEERIKEGIISLLPIFHKEKILNIATKAGKKVGAWLRTQIILCFIMGVISGIILAILKIPFALTLAVWVGITEIIPTVGPILGAIPAILVAFTVSPLYALIVLLLYIGVQQLESQILVPNIMKKAVGLSPVVIIIALLIGAKLMGITGAVLAIPAAAAISVIIREWRASKT